MKKFTMGGMFVGSGVGGYLPLLWGAGTFSVASILLSCAGGFLGIYLGFKLGQLMGE